MKSALLLTAISIAILTAGNSHAALILQPSGLNPGDQYRLVFVTSTERDATSTDIVDYNTFVQAAADASPLSALGQSWKVIGSTASVDARDNTSTNQNTDGSGVPIYLVDGTKIADDNIDLWDDTIEANINWTEANSQYDGIPWTGTTNDGTAFFYALGADYVAETGFHPPMTGDTRLNIPGYWIASAAIGQAPTYARSFYAMSGTITVIPEPSSLLLVAMASLGLLTPRRRKK